MHDATKTATTPSPTKQNGPNPMTDTANPISDAVGYMLGRRDDNSFRSALARAVRPEGELSGIVAMGTMLGRVKAHRRTGVLRGLALAVNLNTDTKLSLGRSLALAHKAIYGTTTGDTGFSTSVQLLHQLDLEPAVQVLGNLLHRAHHAGVSVNAFNLVYALAHWDDEDRRRQIFLDMYSYQGGTQST